MPGSGEHRVSRPSGRLGTRTVAELPSADRLAAARRVTLAASGATVAAVIDALPDPRELPPGTLVVVPGEVAGASSLARSVLAVFGRARTVPRAVRCSALVARGYVEVGAAEDGRADLAWGRVPTEPC
jgi:hypothetical protein